MNRLLGLCMLVNTGISIIVHRREIAEAWRAMVPEPVAPAPIQLDGRLLREVMDITR